MTTPAHPLAPAPMATEAPVQYATATEWLDDLGDVPLRRILFTPWPGTATEADLLRLAERGKRLCELINGTLVEKTMGFYESQVALALAYFLMNFVLPRRLGSVSGEAGMLRLAQRVVRMPDVAFISHQRFRGKLPLEPIPSIAPDLAVEILSESNTRKEMDRKIAEYFDAGTRMVWIIDPLKRSAVVHRPSQKPEAIDSNGKLLGADVLPDFELSLQELFNTADQMSIGLQ
jgi:Uma2 family endonuclease